MAIKFLLFLLAFTSIPSLWAQQSEPRRKPVLIRADEPEAPVDVSPVVDPVQAEESLKIGNFYFKRKNFKAAEKRFRQAASFWPTWPDPYRRLVDSLEKQRRYQDAVDVCDLFLLTNPESEKADEFRKLLDVMKSKVESS